MSNVNFQLVLKECVLPNYFILNKLRLFLADRSEFSDFDMDQAKDAIEILHFSNYKGTNRFILGFSIDFSIADSLGLDYTQKLILAFGKSFRDENDIVEGIFRFQDNFMLEEIIEFHKEIYDIEMKIREVLTYILAFNFPHKDLFNCIEEFEGINFGNERLKKVEEHRVKVFNEFLENEIFHIIFTKYGLFKYPKPVKVEKIYELIQQSSSFDELKTVILEGKGITEKFNPYHKIFVNELASNLQQIEDVRNEIMHNREVKESETYTSLSQKTGYKTAKNKFDELIKRFWEQEKDYNVDDFSQVDYILKTLSNSLMISESDLTIAFADLNFEYREADDLNDLKTQFLEIVNAHLTIEDQISLERVVDEKLKQMSDVHTL